MVKEISPELIGMLIETNSTTLRHDILVLQKMKDDLLVGNVVFFAILLELSTVVLPSHFLCSLENFLTC